MLRNKAFKSLVKSIAAQEAPNGMSCHLIALGLWRVPPNPQRPRRLPFQWNNSAAIGHLTGPLAQQLSGTILDLSGGWRLRQAITGLSGANCVKVTKNHRTFAGSREFYFHEKRPLFIATNAV